MLRHSPDKSNLAFLELGGPIANPDALQRFAQIFPRFIQTKRPIHLCHYPPWVRTWLGAYYFHSFDEAIDLGEALDRAVWDARYGQCDMPPASCDQACTENEDFKGLGL